MEYVNLGNKVPDSIHFTRNPDGTYKVIYTGVTLKDYDSQTIYNGKIEIPRVRIEWIENCLISAIPIPIIKEFLKCNNEDETVWKLYL